MTNCILIGLNAGADLTDNSDGIVIIGDNIRSLDKSQKNVLFIGEKCTIGETLQDEKINLKEVIERFIAKNNVA